jgi:adenylylsulfate kinase
VTEAVTRAEREERLRQRGVVAWLTGLSGSGKTTLALGAERALHERGYLVRRLDGDEVRRGLNAGLGFSMEDRRENIRRLAEAARLHAESGLVVLVAAISPTREIRALARDVVGPDDFLEVFVSCPLEVCEARDAKGMYARARAGRLLQFTGVDSAYEAPPAPALEIRTDELDVDTSVLLLAGAVEALAALGVPRAAAE